MRPLSHTRVTRLRRIAFCAAVAAACWALIAWATGGVSLHLGAIQISSRNPRNPFLLAVLFLAAAWGFAPRAQRHAALLAEVRWLRSVVAAGAWATWRGWTRAEAKAPSLIPAAAAPAVAIVLAVTVVVTGFRLGAFVAAGSDASGYVNHAGMWASGQLRHHPPLMPELTREIPASAFTPLAYRVAADGKSIVPVTAPGLPLAMAAVHRFLKPEAIYWVVPFAAGFAILAAYALGSILYGRWIGVGAALLLASSPSFIFQLTSSPMSDIPAAMWWTVALACAFRPGSGWALASGVAAGAAILTRPNLVPLVLVPALWFARTAWGQGLAARTLRPLAAFVLGVVPACVGIAVLYRYWYGSPLSSGYGELEDLYAWKHVLPNLARYPRWLLESQSPAVALAAAVPLLVRTRNGDDLARAFALIAFGAAVFACYLLYIPFDAWWYLRFLLPAYAPILVLTSAAVVLLATRVVPAVRISAAIVVFALISWQTLTYAHAASAFTVAGEWKYKEAGLYVDTRLPERAAIFAAQHSGSAYYYAGRLTFRYTLLPPNKLDWTVDEVRRLGYEPYLLLEDWEEEEFRARFASQRAVEVLDRGPDAELTGGSPPIYYVRLYRLAATGQREKAPKPAS